MTCSESAQIEPVGMGYRMFKVAGGWMFEPFRTGGGLKAKPLVAFDGVEVFGGHIRKIPLDSPSAPVTPMEIGFREAD